MRQKGFPFAFLFMDTIVALATPLGRSGIAVVRLSGENALLIAKKLIDDDEYQFKPRFATLKKIFSPVGRELIDEVIITYFKAPQSFTGEDVIEISCHGSPVVIRQIIDACLQMDARLASPGEFSLRALGNGRMNLSQAEAIRDLIDSQTVAAARQSVRQLRGELSNQLQPLKDDLLSVIVILESALEFVEDDLPPLQNEHIKNELLKVAERIGGMASTFASGKLLRVGLKVAIAGRPNVGKSSLFNSLLGQERAIVTDIAGTTRDSLHESLSIHGIPVSLIDTAGLRDTSDTVESIGVKRAKMTLAEADLVVVVLDGSEELAPEDERVLEEVKGLNYIIAINKIDLSETKLNLNGFGDNVDVLRISAKTGQGLEQLQAAMVKPFISQNIENKGFVITDARHADLLNRAKSEIESSLELLEQKASEEIVLIGLHNALSLLGQITGETTTEDMLQQIFSTFCIGK
jgi:tRNA modification GTPase TrmE